MPNDTEGAAPDKTGNVALATPDKTGEAGNVDSKAQAIPNELEELTYKERYSNSTREAQRLMEENKQLKDKLGLQDDPKEESADKKTEESTDEKKETEEEKIEPKKEGEPAAKPEEKKEEIPDPVAEAPKVSDKIESQTAFEVVWDLFAEKNPSLNKPEVADKVAKEIKRFSVDAEGNAVSYKRALNDAYQFVMTPELIKQASEKARNEGIIQATKNKEGSISSTTTRTSSENTPHLTDEEKKVARSFGFTDEEYLAQKTEETV